METYHAGAAHQVQIACEYDVITVRQDVRQLARVFGLGLAEQAKLAAAVSGVARALLAQQGQAAFTIKTVGEGRRKMLEIVSLVCPSRTCLDARALEQLLRLDEARLLVDEATVLERGHELMLVLRIRLTRLPLSS